MPVQLLEHPERMRQILVKSHLSKMRIIRCSSRTWAMTERALDTFRA